ncbi:MAG: protoporphyrinogen oxidase, partial [Nitrospira sp.]
VLQQDESTLTKLVREELRTIAGITAEPSYVNVNRWDRAMPQYTLGHLDRLDTMQRSLDRYPSLVLAGAAYRGIGIPDCIKDGTEAAGKLVGLFAGRRG